MNTEPKNEPTSKKNDEKIKRAAVASAGTVAGVHLGMGAAAALDDDNPEPVPAGQEASEPEAGLGGPSRQSPSPSASHRRPVAAGGDIPDLIDNSPAMPLSPEPVPLPDPEPQPSPVPEPVPGPQPSPVPVPVPASDSSPSPVEPEPSSPDDSGDIVLVETDPDDPTRAVTYSLVEKMTDVFGNTVNVVSVHYPSGYSETLADTDGSGVFNCLVNGDGSITPLHDKSDYLTINDVSQTHHDDAGYLEPAQEIRYAIHNDRPEQDIYITDHPGTELVAQADLPAEDADGGYLASNEPDVVDDLDPTDDSLA